MGDYSADDVFKILLGKKQYRGYEHYLHGEFHSDIGEIDKDDLKYLKSSES